jgi:hypothetical protein
MMPMMGGGFVLMLLFLCLVVAVPLLIVALIAGGGLTTLFKPWYRTRQPDDAPARTPKSSVVRKCTTCGRGVEANWNVCPFCGAALN